MSKVSKLTKAQQIKAAKVIELISGGKSLRAACKIEKTTPGTFRDWRVKDDDLTAHYARARDDRAANIFEDILDIADDLEADPQDRRTRIDARKWMLGKMAPKKYGDKIEHEGSLNITVSGDVRKL